MMMTKVKIKFALEQATKAQWGSRVIALLFSNLGANGEWVVNATPRPQFTPAEDPVPIV